MQAYNLSEVLNYLKAMNVSNTSSSNSSSFFFSSSFSSPSSSSSSSSLQSFSDDYVPNATLSPPSPSGSDVGSSLYLTATPIICAFGIVGIILTVIVLSRKTMRTSTNCYLTALSLADLFYLVILASMLTSNQWQLTSDVALYVSMMYTTYASIAMQVLLMASVWLTVVLAIERYVAICRPFLAVWLCTVRKARAIIGVVFLLAAACRLPNFWEKRLAVYYDPDTNKTIYYPEDTELCDNPLYTTYLVLVDALLVSVLPFILLVVLNVLLIVQVRSSTKYLQRNSRGSTGCIVAQKEEQQVTVMLISVIIVFFICTAPYLTYTAINSINSFDTSASGIHLLRYVTILLLTLKSAINFIVYCWFSEKFWLTLKVILRINRCGGKRRKTMDDSMTCSFRLVSRQ